jgi:hypothetical protein
MPREADTDAMLPIASLITQNQMRRSLRGALATNPTPNDEGAQRA